MSSGDWSLESSCGICPLPRTYQRAPQSTRWSNSTSTRRKRSVTLARNALSGLSANVKNLASTLFARKDSSEGSSAIVLSSNRADQSPPCARSAGSVSRPSPFLRASLALSLHSLPRGRCTSPLQGKRITLPCPLLSLSLQRLYVVGRDESKVRWRILKIDRSEPSDLVLTEDPVCYDKRACHKLIRELAEGNKGSGGLHLLAKAHGIVGEPPLPCCSPPAACAHLA